MRRQKGYSLISVLVVTAIGAVLTVAVMALIDNLSRLMLRARVVDALETTITTVATVLGNPQTCDNALRGAGPGDKIVYTVFDNPEGPPPGGNEVDIQNIFAQEADNTPGATAIISTIAGSELSRMGGGRVRSIRFREQRRAVGRGRLRKDGNVYNSYAGEVEIRVQTPTGMMEKVLPLTVIQDPNTFVIEGCYVRDRSMQALCNSMGGAYDPANGSCRQMMNRSPVNCEIVCSNGPTGNTAYAGGFCIRACGDTGLGSPLEKAVPVYHVIGFEYKRHVGGTGAATAMPICACTVVRYNTPTPAPPVSPAPIAPPAPPAPPPPSN